MRKPRPPATGVSVLRGNKIIKNFPSLCGCSQYYYPHREISYLNCMIRTNNGKFTDKNIGLSFVKNQEIGKTKRMQAYKVQDKRTKKILKIPTTKELSNLGINTNKGFYRSLDYWGNFENDMYKVWRA